MSEFDGLFENPNQSPEHQRLDTLNAIKDDTSAIREAIYRFGGKEIELMQSQQAQQKLQHKQLVKAQIQAVRTAQKNTNITEKPKRSSNSAKNQLKEIASQTVNIKVLPNDHRKTAQQATEKNSEQLKQLDKTLKKPIKAELPNGWGYDKQGRIRDKFGKYVSQKELKKHGLHDKNRDTETEKEASDRRLLDALSGIKDAVETPQDLDPTINATQELSAPFKRVFAIGKSGVDAGRGMGKVFGDTVKQSRWRERFSSLFRKSLRDSEKRENRMIDFLRKIWKKDANGSGGWLGKLLFFIPLLLRAFGSLTNGLKKFALFRVLLAVGKLLGGGVGKIFPPLGKLLVGAGRGVGGVGKGVLKRVPILGSLLAFKDNGMAGGIGAIVGGVLGSAFGPIGSIIGTLFGEQVGVWLAGLDWAAIGEWFKEKWNVITEVWEPIGKWFQEQWESTLKFFSNIGNKILNFFKDLLPESAVKGISNAVDTVKEYGGKAVDTVKEYGGKALDKAKAYLGSTGDWIGEQWNSVTNWFNSDTPKNAQANAEENDEQSQEEIKLVANTSRLQALLEDIRTATIDTFNLLKERLNNLIYPNGIDTAGVPIPQASSTASGIAMTAVNLAQETIAASDYAINNAAKKSLGQCALYVNNALRKQGIKIQGNGKDVAANLLNSNQGFNEVKYDENYIPQIGDVMSMPSSSKSKHNYGHVAIFTEKGWVSDFVQGNKYGNTAAANQHYWNDIQSGRIKPTIARKAGNAANTVANMVMSVGAYAEGTVKTQTGKQFSGFGTEIDSYISEAAQRYGIDEKMLRGLVKMEGGWTGKDSATRAIGVGQFTKRTWNGLAKTKEGKAIGMTPITSDNLGKSNDPRRNNHINTLATALLAKRNRAMLEKRGIAATGENLYMAHNMGEGFVYAIHGKGKFTNDTRRNMDVNGGKGKDTTQFMAYQTGKFRRHYELANGVKLGHSQPVIATSSVAETYAPIPQVPQVRAENPIKIADQIAKQSATTQQKDASKDKEITNNISMPDPIMSFLTQDVSERRIAHIVTGGIARA